MTKEIVLSDEPEIKSIKLICRIHDSNVAEVKKNSRIQNSF